MNISKNWGTMAFALGLALLSISCEKEPDNNGQTSPDSPLQNYVYYGEKSTAFADVKLYFAEDAFVGYNRVAVELFESGSQQRIENASLSFLPLMDMGTTKHSCPFDNPVYSAELEAYQGSATFIMPSSAMASWSFELIINHNGNIDTLSYSLEVKAKAEAKVISFISAADSLSSIFIALKEPSSPEIGLNTLELMVYEKESMMSFPPVSDFSIEVEPEMPSMGHGSPNNEDPISIANGLYRGKVNFTMSGYWKLHLKIKDANGQTLNEDASFDISF